MLPEETKEQKILSEVLGAYDFPGTIIAAERYGEGHINDTFCVTVKREDETSARYMLQRISRAAFPHPEELMQNFVAITSFLRRKIEISGGDPSRETLSLDHTRDGKDFYTDSENNVWRLVPFVEDTVCLQEATPELFEASARAFGHFQRMLTDYPAETLYETIPHFHDTENRLTLFRKALERDTLGRSAKAANEVRFVTEHEADCSVAMEALRQGILPLRVTHNDTKLNNVLFDCKSGEGVCIIDLDPTMPGLAIFDFGDSIRFGANHCREDEKDLSLVNLDLDLYERYTRGFLAGTDGCLTEAELEYLPWGARIITLELGIRFLTDYLEGDHYFRTSYPDHNLDRCRTQFKLLQDMEDHFSEMQAIVAKYAKKGL